MTNLGVLSSQGIVPAGPAVPDVVFLSSFDGVDGATTATDDSLYAHAMTFNGNIQLDTAQQKFGTASLFSAFDFVNNYISIPNHEAFNFGASNWTVEGFLRGFDLTTAGTFLSIGTSPNNVLELGYSTSGGTPTLRFFARHEDAGFGTTTTIQHFHGQSDATWFHWAIQRDDDGIYFFAAGTWIGTGILNGTTIDTSSASIIIGGAGGGTSAIMRGHVDEMRVLNYANYTTAGFTPPSSPFPRP